MKNLITKKLFCSVFVLLGLFAVLTNFAVAQPGSFDTSFGTGGRVSTNVSSADDEVLASAIQPDGKIIVVGYSGSPTQFTVIRYNTNGSPDTSFGAGGTVQTGFNGFSSARTVAIQTDGKIVVGGNANGSFALTRYTTSGQLDIGFGSQGKVLTSIGNLSIINAIAIQPDGKIVAAGFTGKSSDFAVARYTVGGVLDNSFNVSGFVITDFADDNDQATSVKIQSDGKILVAGAAVDDVYTTFALARYNADGSLDANFDGDGKVTTVTDCGAEALGVQTDGKIIVTGSLGDVYVARYAADGSLDSTFGNGGIVTTNVIGFDTAYDLLIDPMGKILVGGSTLSGGNEDMFVTRYQSNGIPDDTFDNGDGSVVISFGTNSDIGYSLSLQSNGRIIVAGSKGDFGTKEFAVAKLIGLATTAANATISGRITSGTRGVASVRVARTDAQGNTTYAITNTFGYYSFYNQTVGQTYILSPNHKSYIFTPSNMVINLTGDYDGANFTAQ